MLVSQAQKYRLCIEASDGTCRAVSRALRTAQSALRLSRIPSRAKAMAQPRSSRKATCPPGHQMSPPTNAKTEPAHAGIAGASPTCSASNSHKKPRGTFSRRNSLQRTLQAEIRSCTEVRAPKSIQVRSAAWFKPGSTGPAFLAFRCDRTTSEAKSGECLQQAIDVPICSIVMYSLRSGLPIIRYSSFKLTRTLSPILMPSCRGRQTPKGNVGHD